MATTSRTIAPWLRRRPCVFLLRCSEVPLHRKSWHLWPELLKTTSAEPGLLRSSGTRAPARLHAPKTAAAGTQENTICCASAQFLGM